MIDLQRDIAAIARIDVIPTVLDVVCRVTGMGFAAVARVTEDILPGVVWARDGWPGLNTLTSGEACLTPEASEGLDPRIPGGQSAYDARVEVRPISA